MARLALICAVPLCAVGCHQPPTQTANEAGQSPPTAEQSSWHHATGAIDGDCGHSGANPDGSFEFMVPCPASFWSPDGNWKIVMGAEAPEGGAPVTLQRRDGAQFAEIGELSDGMPFSVIWSPRPNWFLVNHHLGSFMRRPEVYEITSTGVVRHPGITLSGSKQGRRISPCLPKREWDTATGLAAAWSDDGRRIAWVFAPRTDACKVDDQTGRVPANRIPKSFWMISDAESGDVMSGSIRILNEDDQFELPKDPQYKEFRHGR